MGSGTARHRIDQLTDTQREVLRRIAAGETNYAIATALGMTLDGAKYHVSAILDKLGVDSREEAAEAWRRAQRAPSARLARLFALPAAKWAVVATAAVAATAAALWLVTSLADDDEPDPGGFHWMVAYVAADSPDGPFEIAVASDDGTVRRFGQGRAFQWAALSPDRRWLVAVEFPDGGASFSTIETATGVMRDRPVDVLFDSPAWSPDGSAFALLTSDGITIFRPDWTEVASLPVPRGNEQHAFSVLWSPDSRRVVAADGDVLVELKQDGHGRVLELPAGYTEGVVALLGWVDDTRLRIMNQRYRTTVPLADPNQVSWVADLDDRALRWEQEDPAQVTLTFDVNRVEPAAAFAGTTLDLQRACPTADGRGTVFVFAPDRRSQNVTAVLDVAGQFYRLGMPGRVTPTSAGVACPSVVLAR